MDLQTSPSCWKKLQFDKSDPQGIVNVCLDSLGVLSVAQEHHEGLKLILELDYAFIYESNRFEGVGDTIGATRAAITSYNRLQDDPRHVDEMSQPLLDENLAMEAQKLMQLQVINHWKAFVHMHNSGIDDIWTFDGICRLHGILMEGQVGDLHAFC